MSGSVYFVLFVSATEYNNMAAKMSKIIGNGGRYREIYDDSIYIHVFLGEVWWVNEGMVRWMDGWVADLHALAL